MPNPLLSIDFNIPFDLIRPEHVEPAIRQLIAESGLRLEEIAAGRAPGSPPRTFTDTMLALDQMTDGLDWAIGVVRHLEGVATCPELRAAYNAVQPEVSAFYAGIPIHAGLWNTVQDFAATDQAKALTGPRKRFLVKTIDSFRRQGAMLDPDQKRRLEEIDVALATVTTKVSENVLDSTNQFEYVITDPARLVGLPPTAIEAARRSAEGKGVEGWRFTLQAPSYVPLMTYLDDALVREKFYRAHTTRATAGEHDNRGLIARILELRRARATLLSFKDFSDLVLEDRMAHDGASAQSFLDGLRERTQASFERENRELTAFRRSLEGPDALDLAPWDVAYYTEKQRAALYDFDEEVLRPYFPLERVTEGMFEIFRRAFGIRVSEKTGVPAWDSAVKFYEIRDERDATLLGAFYADWYPRENKRDGAWMDAFLTGAPTPAGFDPHLGLICGNLTAPSVDKPALLTHREVETIFHEFGHLLHHCLSRVEIRSLAGTNVAWDFVELPSQIMENWCWERPALDLFAGHCKTGETIPDDLFQKMKRAKTFRSANAQMRQISLGCVDLALHRQYSPETDGDCIAYSRRLLESFSSVPIPPEHAMIASFTHLFGSPVGYGAGYYSYKWAEVLDADAFTRFKAGGVFSREVGLEFRERILAKGDSEDPAELYRGFMGRDPDANALLERNGLLVG
ncbi:MAG: M3 family peptidase [Bryobacterales bacterium]|nr:M3 family peptidase [Bryobacterales bacterium]